MTTHIEVIDAASAIIEGSTEARLAADLPEYQLDDDGRACIVISYDEAVVIVGTPDELRGFSLAVAKAAQTARVAHDGEVAARAAIQRQARDGWKTAVRDGETDLGFDEWLARWTKDDEGGLTA